MSASTPSRHHHPPLSLLRKGFTVFAMMQLIYGGKFDLFGGCRRILTGSSSSPSFVSSSMLFVSAFQLPRPPLEGATHSNKNCMHDIVGHYGNYCPPRGSTPTIPTSLRKCTSLASSTTTTRYATGSSTGWIKPESLNIQTAICENSESNTNNDNKNNNNNNNNIINSNKQSESDETKKINPPNPSPIERLLIRDRLVYIKHDDCLHLPSSNISGNKARKFFALNQISAEEFPEAIVSYGGPQSNAMVALAAVVCAKNAELSVRGSSGQNIKGENNHSDGDDNLFWELDVEELEEGIRARAEEDETLPNLTSADDNDGDVDEKDGQINGGNDQLQSTKSHPKKRFIYYTKAMPRYLKKYPNGNLLRALALGMEIRTLSHSEYNRLFGGLHGGSVLAPADLDVPVPGKSLWMPQGGACSIAEPGSDNLAKEIIDFWSTNGKGMPLAVCVPGGTCTTALLLHRSIQQIMQQRRMDSDMDSPLDIRVVVIPCVGDDGYALRQMMSLDKAVGGRGKREDMPHILRPRSDIEYGSARRRSGGYFTFGEPAKAILQCFDEMNEAGLFLDLLYGAPAWSLLLQHWRSRDLDCPIAGRQVMYVHSGGLEGIASQMTRYKHKGLLDERTIQSS